MLFGKNRIALFNTVNIQPIHQVKRNRTCRSSNNQINGDLAPDVTYGRIHLPLKTIIFYIKIPGSECESFTVIQPLMTEAFHESNILHIFAIIYRSLGKSFQKRQE